VIDAPVTTPTTSRTTSAMPGFTAGHRWLVHLIFVASGAVSLIYQVLWMRQLGTLFGNTAQATATTLTAFFLGLAIGGWVAGNLAPRLRNPLRAYGWVELGVAVEPCCTSAWCASTPRSTRRSFHAFGHQPSLFLALKFVLGVVVLLPAAALIGATFPLVGQYLLRRPDTLGSGATVLYAVNTLGAAPRRLPCGLRAAARLGFRGAYFLAVGLNVLLAAIVLTAARSDGEPLAAPVASGTASEQTLFAFPTWARIRALAFATGLVTLALEVLWTHMFAQVLHNSVYTFALILISFLVALALGSLLAHALIRRRRNPVTTIGALLGTGSLLVGSAPGSSTG
jgi:spermidine synthase